MKKNMLCIENVTDECHVPVEDAFTDKAKLYAEVLVGGSIGIEVTRPLFDSEKDEDGEDEHTSIADVTMTLEQARILRDWLIVNVS